MSVAADRCKMRSCHHAPCGCYVKGHIVLRKDGADKDAIRVRLN